MQIRNLHITSSWFVYTYVIYMCDIHIYICTYIQYNNNSRIDLCGLHALKTKHSQRLTMFSRPNHDMKR